MRVAKESVKGQWHGGSEVTLARLRKYGYHPTGRTKEVRGWQNARDWVYREAPVLFVVYEWRNGEGADIWMTEGGE